MKLLILFFIIIATSFPQTSLAHESQVNFYKDLLTSNYHETPYTAWVKVIEVKKKKGLHLYPTYMLTCTVIETFKGLPLKTISFLKFIEDGYQEYPIGKEFIVSLFQNPESGNYYLGDNGYDLPATSELIEFCRGLKNSLNGKSPN